MMAKRQATPAAKPKAKGAKQVVLSDNETISRLFRWTAVLRRNQWTRELFPGKTDPQAIALTIKRLHVAFPSISPSEFRKMPASELNEYLAEVMPTQRPQGPETVSTDTATAPKNRGGRPPKWDRLWSVIQEQDGLTPKPGDKAIAKVYNQRFGSVVGQDAKKRATAAIVRQVRCSRRKQNPK